MKLPTRFQDIIPQRDHKLANALMIAYNLLAEDIAGFQKDSKRSEEDANVLGDYIKKYRVTQQAICDTIELCYDGITDEEVQREIKELEARREVLTNEKCQIICRLRELTD